MKKKELVIMGIIIAMVVIGLIMGFVFLLGPTLMPFHFAFLGKTQDQLEPRTFDLFMVMKRIIGAHFLALSFGALLLMRRFAQGDTFVRWSVLLMVLISQIILIYAGYVIQSGLVFLSLNVIEIVLLLFIFFLSRQTKKGNK